mmetsp:Transcript_7394/g.14006  ORF Transcript_7394/g.14006 Transcript_7394/m.14006 type:complete len:93 (-) Transcript_7394:6548-6826(-)
MSRNVSLTGKQPLQILYYFFLTNAVKMYSIADPIGLDDILKSHGMDLDYEKIMRIAVMRRTTCISKTRSRSNVPNERVERRRILSGFGMHFF